MNITQVDRQGAYVDVTIENIGEFSDDFIVGFASARCRVLPEFGFTIQRFSWPHRGTATVTLWVD